VLPCSSDGVWRGGHYAATTNELLFFARVQLLPDV
jgi:hypothetical protein